MTKAMPRANATTRGFTARSRCTSAGNAGRKLMRPLISHIVSGMAAAPAARKSNSVSVSICAISRPRLAPTASRVAISRRRAAARARSIPATLLHAMAISAAVEREEQADEREERQPHRRGHAAGARHRDLVTLVGARLLGLVRLDERVQLGLRQRGADAGVQPPHGHVPAAARLREHVRVVACRARWRPSPSAPRRRCR